MKASLLGEFNRAQTDRGRLTCGPTAALEWLKKHRPKTAVHPSMTDYCDTYKYLKEELSRNQAYLNRGRQSGSAPEAEIKSLENRKTELDCELAAHKEAAGKSRDHYNTIIKKTRKHSFKLTISADYQQSKLVPYWGRSEQPGSTY